MFLTLVEIAIVEYFDKRYDVQKRQQMQARQMRTRQVKVNQQLVAVTLTAAAVVDYPSIRERMSSRRQLLNHSAEILPDMRLDTIMRGERIDSICRKLFPSAFLIFNLCYWWFCLTQEQNIF